MARWLLHVDLDQFQAAVEFRRRPELRGHPVVVGGNGDPQEPRKVVTCASYAARDYGVRAGMALRSAARRCPAAIFLALDMPAYEAASAEVMDLLRTFPVRVGVLGWDEAFLAADTGDPDRLAHDIRAAVAALDLSASVGIGDNTLRAKLATGFAKTTGKGGGVSADHSGTGIFRLTEANWTELMADRPTVALWGIGSRIARRLSALGIETVAQLAAADREALTTEFGPATGPYLWSLGHGVGATEVQVEPRIPVGHSKSETFPRDLTDRAEIESRLVALATEVARETVAADRTVRRVGVTVRTSTFFTRTRQRTMPVPTRDIGEVAEVARLLLDRFDLDRPVRLLGVRLEFVPG